MTRELALRIIEEESLDDFNIFNEQKNRENEIVIIKKNDKWITYATDERANFVIGSEGVFDSESQAWDDFIERLRAGKRLKLRHNGKYF